MLHARPSWPPGQLPRKSFYRFEIALDQGFHSPVRQVSDPARKPFDAGRFVSKEPVADALHSPAHQEPSGYEHRHSI